MITHPCPDFKDSLAELQLKLDMDELLHIFV